MSWVSAMTDSNNFIKANRSKARKPYAVALSDLLPDLLDPVLQKRAGLNTALVGAWPEIAGARIGQACMPSKISWSRANPTDNPFAPATLFIVADPSVALALQHETKGIIARVNSFFGYPAIDRIKISQRTISKADQSAVKKSPDIAHQNEAEILVSNVQNEALREALAKLGANVLASKR